MGAAHYSIDRSIRRPTSSQELAYNHNFDAGMLVIENARLNRRDNTIASAFIERFATDPKPFLCSTGAGPATLSRNDIVLVIFTNFRSVSEDILNRSLPIHLDPVGHISERTSPIGNPKLEYLPRYREHIAAELWGMVGRWKSPVASVTWLVPVFPGTEVATSAPNDIVSVSMDYYLLIV